MMAHIANLHKLQSPEKMVDYRLVPLGLPPLDGDIIFAAGSYDPKGSVRSGYFMNL
jgi:hypothetical protein